MANRRIIIGETLGTFIMVLMGCGSVAVTVLFGAHQGLMQVALVWGIGVTLAIYATRHLSGAHLNPAVSIAMATTGRLPIHQLPIYLLGQFGGAFLAASLLYLLFAPSILAFEQANDIARGAPESVRTAMIFGEFYPNPGMSPHIKLSLPLAMAAEFVGTLLLVLIIFLLTDERNIGRPDANVAPLFIGLTVTLIICLIAPLTQAGLNPARDLAPRLLTMMMGWGSAALPDQVGGFFWVYVAAPIMGGVTASVLFTRIMLPCMNQCSVTSKRRL
ncbi:MAG: MIP family channel protein [Phycisphaerales bacterium]|nr:MIP family channel protein [Phycisphaerales bacterium]